MYITKTCQNCSSNKSSKFNLKLVYKNFPVVYPNIYLKSYFGIYKPDVELNEENKLLHDKEENPLLLVITTKATDCIARHITPDVRELSYMCSFHPV